jgi:hypothetical protein
LNHRAGEIAAMTRASIPQEGRDIANSFQEFLSSF